jgi:hypothetical protein
MMITISMHNLILMIGGVISVSFFIGHGFDRMFGRGRDNDISEPRHLPGSVVNAGMCDVVKRLGNAGDVLSAALDAMSSENRNRAIELLRTPMIRQADDHDEQLERLFGVSK